MRTRIKKNLDNLIYILKASYKASPINFAIRLISSAISISISIVNLFLLGKILDKIFIENNNMIIFYSIIFIILFLIDSINKILSKYANRKYEDYLKRYIDNSLINKIPKIEYEFFDSSTILTDIEDSWTLIDGVKTLIINVLDFISETFNAIIIIVVILKIFPLFALLVIFCIIPIYSIHIKINNLQWSFDRENTRYNRILCYYKNVISEQSCAEIKVFNAYDFFIQQYMNTWKEWHELKISTQKHMGLLTFLYNIGLFCIDVGLIVIILYKLAIHTMLLGNAIYYISLGANLSSSLENSINAFMQIKLNMQEINKLRRIMSLDEIPSHRGNNTLKDAFTIEFQNVSFCYPNSDKFVLDNCSFKIMNREKIGLVGLNGSGKSTIFKLLLGLYEPTKGRILINGVDISKYDLKELQGNIGVFFQDYVRYSLSFRENVGISNIELMNNDEIIREICNVVGFQAIIEQWNYCYDVPLTKRFFLEGKELSGGEWQKVCLMRAVLGEKKIYILDEPSSALDPQAEHDLFGLYNMYVQSSTSILITHRLSNVIDADRILLIEQGKVVEQGTHKELMVKNGRYAYIYNIQAMGYKKDY